MNELNQAIEILRHPTQMADLYRSYTMILGASLMLLGLLGLTRGCK